jgi:hypothetical protein
MTLPAKPHLWLVLGFWFVLAAVLLASCGRDLTSPTRPMPNPPFTPTIDDDQTWSPDGLSIAYHRKYPSADGPPGIYIIPSAGGTPRY